MEQTTKYLIPDIQHFAEGGAGGGAEGGTSGEGASGVADGVSLPSSKRGSKNPLADVVYGKSVEEGSGDVSSSPTEADDVQNPEADRQAQFEKLIKEDFKDLYDARVQDTIQKRLKSTKETVDKYNELSPVLEMLASKYGVDASDVNALSNAIQEDDAYYEEEALEKGITVEQLKEIKKLERENAQLRAEQEAAEQQAEIDRDIANWMQEAETAREVFPGLDLAVELQNPQFVGLLKSGVDMQTAFFALHHRELVPQAMQYTAKTVEQKLANKVMASGRMPSANGTQGNASAVVKSDVSQLSKADRQEIARRVARGEKITF